MSRYQEREEKCLYLGVKSTVYEQLVATPHHFTLVKNIDQNIGTFIRNIP